MSGVALGAAVFLGLANFKLHGHYDCYPGPVANSCVLRYSYWEAGRAWWQIPAAIAVGVLGFGAAAALAKG